MTASVDAIRRFLTGEGFERRAIAILVVVVGVLLGVPWLGDKLYLYLQRTGWQHRFEQAMERNQEARLADLVGFEWDKVFLLESYDITVPKQIEIFGSQRVYTFWWDQNPKYWTIVYRRPRGSPLIIRMNFGEWGLHRRTFLWSAEKTAKLRLVTPGTREAADCSTRLKRCLVLEDSRVDYAK